MGKEEQALVTPDAKTTSGLANSWPVAAPPAAIAECGRINYASRCFQSGHHQGIASFIVNFQSILYLHDVIILRVKILFMEKCNTNSLHVPNFRLMTGEV